MAVKKKVVTVHEIRSGLVSHLENDVPDVTPEHNLAVVLEKSPRGLVDAAQDLARYISRSYGVPLSAIDIDSSQLSLDETARVVYTVVGGKK